MDARKTALLLAALIMAAAISLKPSEAAGARPNSKPTAITVKTSAPAPAVIVKIGDAMLEEYRGGDPSRRTVILRQDDSARNLSGKAGRNKQHS